MTSLVRNLSNTTSGELDPAHNQGYTTHFYLGAQPTQRRAQPGGPGHGRFWREAGQPAWLLREAASQRAHSTGHREASERQLQTLRRFQCCSYLHAISSPAARATGTSKQATTLFQRGVIQQTIRKWLCSRRLKHPGWQINSSKWSSDMFSQYLCSEDQEAQTWQGSSVGSTYTRLWCVLAHLYKWLSWKYPVTKRRQPKFSYLPLATAAHFIPEFSLKVKYHLQLFCRKAIDYICNASNIALIQEFKCLLQGVVILSSSFSCIKNEKVCCPRVSGHRDVTKIWGLLTHTAVTALTHGCMWDASLHGTDFMISRQENLRNNNGKRGSWERFFPNKRWGTRLPLINLIRDGTSLFRPAYSPWASNDKVEMSKPTLLYLSKAFGIRKVYQPTLLPTVSKHPHPQNFKATFYICSGSVCVHLHKIKQHGSEQRMKVRKNTYYNNVY